MRFHDPLPAAGRIGEGSAGMKDLPLAPSAAEGQEVGRRSMIKVAVLGACGKMGREVVKAVTGADDMELVARDALRDVRGERGDLG